MSSNDHSDQNGHTPFVKPSTRLRQLLAQPGCLQAPGVYDGISARLAIEAGFPCMYQSGAITTASRLGLPDLAFASLNDFVANGTMIANIDPRIPLIADADTGFGGPNAIARTVAAYDRAGIAALHLEDQIQMKRCGHLGGKKLVDREIWKTRIRAAVKGRESVPGGSDIVIIARTDSLAGMGMEEALQRLLDARELGADVGFLEAINTPEQIQHAVKVLAPMPLLLNCVPNSKTPHYTVDQAASWGVKIAIYPVATGNAALHAMRASLADLKATGHDEKYSQGYSPRDFFEVMGLSHEIEVDNAAGGGAYSEGV